MSVGIGARSDEDTRNDVLAELKWEPVLDSTRIEVTVEDGVATLNGAVSSYVQKLVAERGTQRVSGVRVVHNNLEVRLPPVAERTDEDLTKAVKHALEWDVLVPTERIEVLVLESCVTLTGDVEWEYQRSAAEIALRRLAGVRAINNRIHISPSIHASPDEIRGAIQKALIRNVETDASQITMDVAGSHVTLRGSVRHWSEREEAERIAWSAPGVNSVFNDITVLPQGAM
jgi:osmotically-inducible protein OsmY